MIILMTLMSLIVFRIVRPDNSRIFDLYEQDVDGPRVYEAQLQPLQDGNHQPQHALRNHSNHTHVTSM